MLIKCTNSLNSVNVISEFISINETDMVSHWANLNPGTILRDRHGIVVMIFSVGRRNFNEGPDFLNAVIWVNGKAKRGNVELHVNESNWNSHGHGSNSRYDDVILHVVSSFARSPVLKITTVSLEKLIQKKRTNCPIPNLELSPSQLTVLMEMGIHRWKEKVSFYQHRHGIRNKNYFIESLANFGSGENRTIYRSLGDCIFSSINKDLSQSEWNNIFFESASNFKWHRGGTMPARHPNMILEKISKWSYDTFIKNINFKSIKELKQNFVLHGFGQTTWVEWSGNVHFPFMAGRSSSDYSTFLNHWMRLRLPSSYGALKKFFGGRLTQSQLKSYPIAQGLLYLKKHFCSGWHCQICKLKRSK
jgi:hypothetical protein